MIKNRLIAASAAAAIATGTAVMAVPAHAAEATPAPAPSAPAPSAPAFDTSKLPIQIDFECLKNNAHERHQIEAKIAKILFENGATKTKTAALHSAKEIVSTILKNPSLLANKPAAAAKIVKIIADNALKAFGDTSDLADLKPLAEQIVANLKDAKTCVTINLPGLPSRTEHVGNLSDIQTAAWVPASQVR
ncbi:hypothetical protein O6R08_10045 [Cutibacterium equinum]|uniref:Secreted protein n=1 Tax=Cutibacterium equinum TaxID=3016342 RepID=A0ABY7QXM6_9ACTN|nr:hypothetical protein [Cutibacterium equinum]WCC79792.1 hypothetical protein O6R08_10045 [Cutibacterium equinum]